MWLRLQQRRPTAFPGYPASCHRHRRRRRGPNEIALGGPDLIKRQRHSARGRKTETQRGSDRGRLKKKTLQYNILDYLSTSAFWTPPFHPTASSSSLATCADHSQPALHNRELMKQRLTCPLSSVEVEHTESP